MLACIALVAWPASAIAPQTYETPKPTDSYVIAYNVPPANKVIPKNLPACSCITYYKARRGITESLITPKTIVKTGRVTAVPQIGLGVIRAEGPVWHIAYIEDIFMDHMFLSEANYERCKITTRWVRIDDPLNQGFF